MLFVYKTRCYSAVRDTKLFGIANKPSARSKTTRDKTSKTESRHITKKQQKQMNTQLNDIRFAFVVCTWYVVVVADKKNLSNFQNKLSLQIVCSI